MKDTEIIEYIRSGYNLNNKVKIRNLDIERQEFRIKMGDSLIDLCFPNALKRAIKLNELGI